MLALGIEVLASDILHREGSVIKALLQFGINPAACIVQACKLSPVIIRYGFALHDGNRKAVGIIPKPNDELLHVKGIDMAARELRHESRTGSAVV